VPSLNTRSGAEGHLSATYPAAAVRAVQILEQWYVGSSCTASSGLVVSMLSFSSGGEPIALRGSGGHDAMGQASDR
jgi:hypothetical protein